MIIMWLLWPLTLTMFVFGCIYYTTTGMFVVSIIFAVLVSIMWLSYFINSFRLFRRARSAWAFNPECNMLLTVPLRGRTITRPMTEASPVVNGIVLRGYLRMAGNNIGRCDLDSLPKEVTVASPSNVSYYKMQYRYKIGVDSGVVVFLKYKTGNHRVPVLREEDADKVALLVP